MSRWLFAAGADRDLLEPRLPALIRLLPGLPFEGTFWAC
jgi:hypothetical protein